MTTKKGGPMKALLYTGNLLITEDDVADAAIGYAAMLAQNSRVERISIPVLVEGATAQCDLLIGSGMPLAMVPAPESFARLDDGADAVASLRERAAKVPRPVHHGNPYVSSSIDDLSWFG
jgi:hypothetical protein